MIMTGAPRGNVQARENEGAAAATRGYEHGTTQLGTLACWAWLGHSDAATAHLTKGSLVHDERHHTGRGARGGCYGRATAATPWGQVYTHCTGKCVLGCDGQSSSILLPGML